MSYFPSVSPNGEGIKILVFSPGATGWLMNLIPENLRLENLESTISRVPLKLNGTFPEFFICKAK